MIIRTTPPPSTGCCVNCGCDLSCKNYAYWNRAKVCQRCYDRHLRAATNYEFHQDHLESQLGIRNPGSGVIVALFLGAVLSLLTLIFTMVDQPDGQTEVYQL